MDIDSAKVLAQMTDGFDNLIPFFWHGPLSFSGKIPATVELL